MNFVYPIKPAVDRYCFDTDEEYKTYVENWELVKKRLTKHFEATTQVNSWFSIPGFVCETNPYIDADHLLRYRKAGTCMAYMMTSSDGKDSAVSALVAHKMYEYDAMVSLIESDCRRNRQLISFMRPLKQLSDKDRELFNRLKNLAYDHYYKSTATKRITPDNEDFNITQEYLGGDTREQPDGSFITTDQKYKVVVKFNGTEFSLERESGGSPVEMAENVVRAWEKSIAI